MTAPVFAHQNQLSCYVGIASALLEVYHLTIFSSFWIRKGKSKITYMIISTNKTTPLSLNRNFYKKPTDASDNFQCCHFKPKLSCHFGSHVIFIRVSASPTHPQMFISDPIVFDQICKEELSVHFPHISENWTKFPSCFWS